MVSTGTILCQTQGIVGASTPQALLNPMTGQNAELPEGAAVRNIAIYRDGDQEVTSGCIIQLGVDGNINKYVEVADSINTTALNTGHLINKQLMIDVGLSQTAPLLLTVNNAVSTGGLIFEVTYAVYA